VRLTGEHLSHGLFSKIHQAEPHPAQAMERGAYPSLVLLRVGRRRLLRLVPPPSPSRIQRSEIPGGESPQRRDQDQDHAGDVPLKKQERHASFPDILQQKHDEQQQSEHGQPAHDLKPQGAQSIKHEAAPY
jgi:hypothetical protein